MEWKWLGILVVLFIVYLLIGAGIFQAIEQPNEIETCEKAKLELQSALADINRTCGSLQQLRDFSNILQNAIDSGVKFDNNMKNLSCTIENNWNFENAFFFSGTVVTTIGYGNISPSTNGGKTFCIIYALIGIPLFALMFSGLGDKISARVTILEEKVKGKAKRSWVQKGVVFLIFTISLLVLCLLIPAGIFVASERWDYSDAFYYCFITLTTIGFGDFVVGTNPDISYIPLYRILVYFWIVFGMAYMATAISLISGFFKKRGAKAQARMTGRKEEVDGERPDENGGSSSREEFQQPHYEAVDAVKDEENADLRKTNNLNQTSSGSEQEDNHYETA